MGNGGPGKKSKTQNGWAYTDLRPADGYAPPVLDYITGQPTKDIREN